MKKETSATENGEGEDGICNSPESGLQSRMTLNKSIKVISESQMCKQAKIIAILNSIRMKACLISVFETFTNSCFVEFDLFKFFYFYFNNPSP